ncbi:ankyrin [Acephala macrosclerotiorum]|nr:ankyrin [Acephala macrosclerotiorum]
MDLTTQSIPPSEWEHWKGTILELIRHNTLKKVIALMKDDHDFVASPSQYEARLRTWDCRKNLTKEEWAIVFETVDELKSQHKQSRILISGQEADSRKIQRARRTYHKEKFRNLGRKTTNERSGSLRNVSIEVLGAGGRWSPCANLGNSSDFNHLRNQTRNRFSPLALTGIIGDPSIDFGPGVDEVEGLQPQVYDDIDPFDMEPTLQTLDFSHISGNEDFATDVIGEEVHLVWPEEYQPSPSRAVVQFNFGNTSTESLDWESLDWTQLPWQLSSHLPLGLLDHRNYLLSDLPFDNFMRDLESQGISLIKRAPSVTVAHVHPVENSIKLFLADISSCFSEEYINQGSHGRSNMASIVSSLRSLLPSIRGDWDSRQSSSTEDEMVQAKLLQILLFSTANAFSGLQGVPIQGLLKHLSRYADINMLSHASNSHVGKSMAENLFRAAIEAKDKPTLKCLLALGSIDANSTLCIVEGRRYTPLGRAAYLQDLGVVQLLLKAGADVNKTSDFVSSHQAPLEILVNGVPPGRMIPPEAVEIGKVLLRAGAKVCPDIARQALQTFHSSELAFGLVTRIPDSDHSSLIRDGYLSLVAGYLDDWQATQATTKIIMACERTTCRRCLTDYKDNVDWALVQGAKRGHSQLVQLLKLHSKAPHRALSAAIRCGRKEVIDCILSLDPDLNAPTHSIDDENWNLESHVVYQTITTSFAEAISAGDERLIQKFEDAGSLKCLSEGGRFQPAITAASKIGNMTYIRKLLDCCPTPTPSHLTLAVLYAVHNDHEEAVLTLLAAGADVNLPRMYRLGALPPSPLIAAVLRRNSKMVRAILNADALDTPWQRDEFGYKGVKITLLGEALKWGDMSIIEDLQSTFSHCAVLMGNGLFDVLERGDMAVFDFVLKSRMATKGALTKCLKLGLDRGDDGLIRKLVQSGADPTDSAVLKLCVEKRPEMLHLLLALIPLPENRHIMPNFGAEALCAAIRRGSAGVKAVNLLLDSGLVDVSSGHGSDSNPLITAIETSQSDNHADFQAIKKLLDAGCDPNRVYTHVFDWKNNETPLLEAIKTKNKDLVQLLISRGATVNREANFGVKRTPLQKAVEVESLEIITLLLKAGADVNSRPATRGGATVFQLAAIRGNCTIAAKLLEHGADLHALPAEINGRWPLEGAAENGRIEMIGYLINNACFDQKQSRRAMELAEGNGYLACRDAIAELLQTKTVCLPVVG